jgi:plastocyanin
MGWHKRACLAGIAVGTAYALMVALPAAATDSTVGIANFQFTPGAVTVDQGDTVTWNWVGPGISHTVVSDPGQADSFDSDSGKTFGPPPSGTFSHRFSTPGTFTYFCSLHTFMKGKVVVNAAQSQSPAQVVVTPQAALQAPKPSFKECISQRNFMIRLRGPRRAQLASATVKVNGEPVPVNVANIDGRRRLTAQVDLRGLPKGQYAVAITAKTKDGRTLQGARTYATCSRKVITYSLPKL